MSFNFNETRPIYLQLVNKLEFEIASGKLSPGQRIISVREFATLAGVNPNTVQRALSVLEDNGLLLSNRTNGRYVTDNTEIIDALRFRLSDDVIFSFVTSMINMGFDKTEVSGLVDEYISNKGDIYG